MRQCRHSLHNDPVNEDYDERESLTAWHSKIHSRYTRSQEKIHLRYVVSNRTAVMRVELLIRLAYAVSNSPVCDFTGRGRRP